MINRVIIPFFQWIVACALVGLFFIFLNWLPASIWYDVATLHVNDAKVGESPRLIVDRSINQDFSGSWVVTVRKRDGQRWDIFCGASQTLRYKPTSILPPDVDLNWWTANQCKPLPAGTYYFNTTWKIEAPSPIPDKTVSIDSNIFEVRP